MKIGLTGSIACGKSTVSAYLRSLGYHVADADAVSRSLTTEGGEALPLVREAFGSAVFDGETLNRRRLGDLVFSDPAALEKLNALLHPLIIAKVRRELDAFDTPDALVFGDIPLLYECGMETLFDRIWVVHAPRDVQIARLLERDGLDAHQAQQRIDAQMPLEEKCRRADTLISTAGTIEETRAQIDAHLSSLVQRRPT